MKAAATPPKSSNGAGEGHRPDAAPIDIAHLRRFTLGDEVLEQEILALFIEQAPRTIDSLKHAYTKRDWSLAAHTLKGSARAVGAWRLARIAERLEAVGPPPGPAARDRLMRYLEQATGEARAHIEALNRLR
jgi:HPt (histidine-containing phosphotransfer) domain-containing protein